MTTGRVMVEAWSDSYAPGMIQVRPVSDKVLRAIKRDMRENGAPDDLLRENTALLSWDDAEDVIARKHLREIERGWTARFLVDPWELRHYYGYAA